MEFMQRVVRIAGTTTKKKIELEDNPSALAATFVRAGREVERREIGFPRASSLHDACMRMNVIGTMEGAASAQAVTVRLRVIYGIGNAVHWWIQNRPEILGDNRLGWWECRACGEKRFGLPPSSPCVKCGAKPGALEYKEHTLRMDGRYKMTGHPDMFVHPPGDGKMIRILEVKTFEELALEVLVAPLAAHVWQVSSYLWACSLDKRLPVKVDPEVGYILYVPKKLPAKEFPMKMFVIRRDENLLKRIQTKLLLYSEGLKGYPKNLPAPVQECSASGFSCWRAKSCPVLNYCKKEGRE